MYITLDYLQKLGACQEALDFIAKYYPEGAELSTLMEKGHIPYSFMHWGYTYLPASDEERRIYCEKMDIVDSVGFVKSTHIHNCETVFQSHHISNSHNIYRSEQVEASAQITSSKYVTDSSYIFESQYVDASSRVLKGKNINDSNEVYDSVFVVSSHGVFGSSNVENGYAIWESKDICDAAFCFGCQSIKNALFCNRISNGQYLLFNKEISQSNFERIFNQFRRYIDGSITFFSRLPEGRGAAYVSHNYSNHTKNISDSFWDWAATLPGYDPSILYALTFNPRFLTGQSSK